MSPETDRNSAPDHRQHGDVVLDRYGLLWTRADVQDQASGRPWARGVGAGPALGRPFQAEGDSAEDDPARPLVLLVRDSRPVGA